MKVPLSHGEGPELMDLRVKYPGFDAPMHVIYTTSSLGFGPKGEGSPQLASRELPAPTAESCPGDRSQLIEPGRCGGPKVFPVAYPLRAIAI